MTAINIPLKTTKGDSINTSEIASDYTVLYFYDLNCGHCATETPRLHNELYEKYKNKGLKIVAINIGSDKEEWIEYIQKQNLTDWINAADMDYKSQYWLNYDLSGIPMTYLLDKDKKIIAKKTVVKKATVKKVAAKKPVIKKVVAKKTVVKKAVAKKPIAKKATVKKVTKVVAKPAVKKAVVAKKTVVKKAVAVKPAVKKVAPKKPIAIKKPIAVKPVVKVKPVAKAAPIKTFAGKPIVKSTLQIISERAMQFKDKTVKAVKEGINELSKERLRYSDNELAEFKKIIEEKLETAKQNLIVLKEAYANTGENDISDTSPSFKVLEEGYQVLSKEENAQLAARQQKFISSLEAALVRIANKTYGICRETGKLIDKERLKIVPHATLSIEAKRDQKKR
jgi:RNA polymerase-binding transcription factor DksA/peroxiredoxin